MRFSENTGFNDTCPLSRQWHTLIPHVFYSRLLISIALLYCLLGVSFEKLTWSFPIQARQETDKSAAVATVVAAVDMARVREPVISAVEHTAQRTTTTAVHIQPAQEQVGTWPTRMSWTCRDPVATLQPKRMEGSPEPTVAQISRTLSKRWLEIPRVFKIEIPTDPGLC